MQLVNISKSKTTTLIFLLWKRKPIIFTKLTMFNLGRKWEFYTNYNTEWYTSNNNKVDVIFYVLNMSKIILIKYYNFTFIVIFQRLHLNIYINEGQVDMENLQNEVSINENKINQLCQMCILSPTGPEVWRNLKRYLFYYLF